ncbi:MAG TPA: carboxypeptidase regulatory-like domain-containing protein [Vicinamibacterales bacterium]|nr:carboxypeptidase regulatory-like domain-containing protein [Vicinamibacterales bacterium]
MRLKVLLAVACVLVTIQIAVAQVPIGTISGRVLDQSGQAVPGVTVTATSPALQGARDAVTTAAGDYLLPLLPPGAYTVRYELTGFETVTRMIAVAATQAVPMDVALAVARVGEAVTVTAEASPFVQTAQVATNINQDLAATLPTSRSMVASVLLAPNVKASGPGGTQGADGALAISGAMSFDSIYMINGVAVTENLRGQPFNLFIEDALQETTVATAGVSAEYGRFGGGIVNAITKSGGNRFSGSFRDSFNNDSWRTTTPFKETRLDKTIPTYEYTLGGPVARDRIWFFTAGRIRNSEDARQTFVTNISYPRRNEEKRFEGKITSSLTPNHSVRGSYLKITQLVVNNIFQNGMDLRSLFNQGQPQDLLSLNYNGIFGRSLTIEGQYSSRHFAISGAGAPSTDLVEGTLLVDRSRGSAFRYWAPTFCAVCGDEHRDNTEALAKATYFLSSDRLGTHTIVFGYDGYNDHRFANNHQSGSDFRILGTSTIVDGATIYPVFNGTNNSTIVQWNPIAMSSNGTDLLTHSVFVNDSWRAGSRVTLNLGLRFDRNAGEDAANNQTSTSSAFSPRLGVVWDPRGDQKWAITSSFARYVSALNSAIAENSPAGNPATYTWFYQGPSVNVDTSGPLVGPEAAIKQVFDWLDANGGTSRTFTTADVPGVNTFVDTTLESPSSYEYAAGVSRSFSRGSVRADYVFRDFKDFYATRTDLTSGRVTNSLGVDFDVNLIGNSDLLTRRYQGVTAQGVYRLGDSAELGSSYTLSRLWGNFDGETSASGPVTAGLLSYPEYRETSWNQPTGDLFGDQRHRGRAWGIYRVPMAEPHGSADLGLLFTAASGVPLGGAGLAVGQIDPRPYVVNPGYAKPLGTATTIDDFFFPRDRFRTEAQYRTDVSMNYSFRFAGGVQAFFHGDVLNIFNQFQLCGCGGTVFDNGGGSDVRNISTNVLTASTTASLQPFNPFTTAPVEGVNYQRASNFGQATNRFAYTSPRTFRFNIGVRF